MKFAWVPTLVSGVLASLVLLPIRSYELELWHLPRPALALGSLAILLILLFVQLRRSGDEGIAPLLCLAVGLIWTWAFLLLGTRYAAVSEFQVIAFTAIGCLSVLTQIHAFLRIVSPLIVVQSLAAIFEPMWSSDQFHTMGLARAGGTFGFPTQLASAMAFFLPLLLFRLLQSRRASDAAIFAISATALLLTWNRGVVLAATGGAVITGYRWYRAGTVSKRFFVGFLVAAVCFGLLPFYVRTWTPDLASAAQRSNHGRMAETASALQAAIRHPLGVGPTEVNVPFSHVDSTGATVLAYAHDAKNQLVSTTLQFGYVGGIVACLFVWLCLQTIFRVPQHVSAGLEGSLITVLVLCQFETPFFMQGHEITSGLLGMMVGMFTRLVPKRTGAKGKTTTS